MNDYLVKPFLADDLEKIIRVIPPDTGQPAPPKQNKFNLSHVEKASLGDQAFMAQLLNLFLDSTPESVGKMQSAAREENWDALGALAHKNRSIFTTLGLEDLTNQLERIETFSRGETDVNSENINILLRRFTGGYQRIFAEIREARDQLLITETKKE
jgi:HPt (histidine-containing phosphotransfer) domain-containing protein